MSGRARSRPGDRVRVAARDRDFEVRERGGELLAQHLEIRALGCGVAREHDGAAGGTGGEDVVVAHLAGDEELAALRRRSLAQGSAGSGADPDRPVAARRVGGHHHPQAVGPEPLLEPVHEGAKRLLLIEQHAPALARVAQRPRQEPVDLDRRFLVGVELAQGLGKTAVEVNDFPGFVSNRVLMPMINEAVFALMEGVADAKSIDTVMKLGMNHPMGPLELADLIGLDTCLSILEVLHRDLGDDRYRPCPLLRKHVAAGWLGRKTRRGFHAYE